MSQGSSSVAIAYAYARRGLRPEREVVGTGWAYLWPWVLELLWARAWCFPVEQRSLPRRLVRPSTGWQDGAPGRSSVPPWRCSSPWAARATYGCCLEFYQETYGKFKRPFLFVFLQQKISIFSLKQQDLSSQLPLHISYLSPKLPSSPCTLIKLTSKT